MTTTENTTDIGDTIEPKSNQMNADDLLTGPRTFTIDRVVVRRGADDQPVDIYLKEFPSRRPFKPSKSMRRVMVAGWGERSVGYAGHRFTLFRDPDVLWAGAAVGGIRISHMSHLPGNKPLNISLTKSSTQREPYTVLPLADDAVSAPVVTETTLAELAAMFARKGIPDDARLPGVNAITGGSATALEVITETEAQSVLATLAQRPDTTPPAPTDAPAPDAPHEYVNDPDAGSCAVRLADGSTCGELEDRPPHTQES